MGVFAIRRNGRRVHLSIRGKTLTVLLFLATSANKNLRKESLINEIWLDQDPVKSRPAFATAIWRIKNVLAKFPDFSIISDGDLIKLSTTNNVFIDIMSLESALADISKFECGENFSKTNLEFFNKLVVSCSGKFLEGQNAHWALAKREFYASIYIRLLSCLMRHYAEQCYFEQALFFGRKILIMDPLREVTQREVMQLYVLNGERAKALKQFSNLACLLNDELGIMPLQETTDLFNTISQENYQNLVYKRPNLSRLSHNLA